jgi:hypothetical protein
LKKRRRIIKEILIHFQNGDASSAGGVAPAARKSQGNFFYFTSRRVTILFHFETFFYLSGVVSHCNDLVYGFKNL